jgi:hypothetical protein
MITNIINTLLALFIITLLFASCRKDSICEIGNKKIERKELFLNEIHSIKLYGSGNLYISYGQTQKIEVETNKDLFDVINQNVNNGHWDATFKGCVKKYSQLNFYVTIPKVDELQIEGSGKIQSNDTFSVEELKLEINGSGKINFKTIAQNLNNTINGSGEITLEGSCNNHSIKIRGSGNLHSYNMESKQTQVKVSGSGDARVNVNQKLNVTIEGSGKVVYKGSPIKEINILGSGSVKPY